MFNSVSACTPDSPVSTSFVSTQTQLLNISSNVTVSVNETVITSRPVTIAVNDRVVATVTTPLSYLGYEFHEYYLNGTQQYFAVVNKNNYHPSVKNVDATKKWFNYLPTELSVSFYYSVYKTQRPLGAAHGIVDIEKTHIVLDHINDAVLFYTTNQTLATRVKLPAGPVEYRKLNYIDPSTNQSVTEAIVLCGNKRLYRIIFNNRYFNSDTFSPTVVQAIGLSGLWYEQDTPTGQSFIDARRSYIRSKLNPDVTALDISTATSNIWIAGYDSVFILTSNFQEINRVISTRETFISLACIGNDAIVTTRLGKAYYVTSTGIVTLIYQASALGNPCTIDSGTAVVIPDPNNQRLLRFNDSSGTYTVIETPDINPAYPRMFDGALWVTGYDSNQVLKITGSGSTAVTYSNAVEIERLNFNDKVTLVSVVGTSILATHYLQEFVTLDLTDVVKVIPFPVKFRKGPVSHIGTETVELKMLGQESIMPVAGPGLTYWVNGSYGQMANTGDYFGISFKATGNGVFRRPFIIGETAFDYNVEASSSVLVTDYYRPNVVSAGISGNVTTELIPQFGNTWIGFTGPLELGFSWNMYGTTYSNISVGTTGAITFGNTTPNLVPGFGNLNVDALYVETAPIYQRLPITNVDPLNVGYKQVTTTQPMGVYYTSGMAGNFDYFKLRWVGITADPYPDGNTITIATTVTSTITIPVDDLTVANIGDYVSGNGITTSTRVTGIVGTQAYSANVLTTVSNTNTLVLDSITGYNLTSIPQYSKVTNVATGAFTYLLSAIQNRVVQNGVLRLLTGVSNGTIYIEYYDGVIDPIITVTDYRAVLPVPSQVVGSQYSTISVNITSITQTVVTTPFIIVGSSSIGNVNLLILQVDPSFYATSFRGRKVYVDSIRARSIYVYGQYGGNDIAVYYTGSYIASQPGATGTLSVDVTEITTTDNISTVVVNPILNPAPGGGYGSYFGSISQTGSTTTVEFEKIQINVIDSSIINSGPIVIQGNLIQVAPNISVTNGTSLLFKTDLPMPVEHTYEVAFYVGRTFQFLEYYYKNSNHSAGANIGVSSSNAATLSTSVRTGPNTSIVFFSPADSGNWTYTGPGYIDPVAKIFAPRFPVIANSTPEFGTQARIEFVINQEISANAKVLLATTFGYLTVNSGVYDGNTIVKENDTVSLTVPFNNSLSTVVPVISIGDYQFAIPMQSISAPSAYIETVYSYPDQQINDYVTAQILVPVSDSYYLPDYYRVSGNAFVFTRTQGGGSETPIDAGLVYDFNAGDVITVYNQLTPTSIYDRREVVLASPSFVVRTSWETSAGPLFDNLDFGTLIEPYIDNYEYSFTNYLGTNLVNISPEIYETANITLTANTAITGNLYIDMYSSDLVVNGTSRGDYVTNVSTGANISLTRKLMHYFQDDVIVYQVKYDTSINSNVYIPIGSWNINNKIISGSVKEKSYSVETNLFLAQETDSHSELSGATITPRFRQESILDTDGVVSQLSSFDGTHVDIDQMAATNISSASTYSLVGTVSGGMLPSSYINIGSIGAKRSGAYSFFGPPRMTAINLGRYVYLTSNLFEFLKLKLYTEIQMGPLVSINSDRYSMIMPAGGVVTNVLPAPSAIEGNLSVVVEDIKTSLLEFDITGDITQGSNLTSDAFVWEYGVNTTLLTPAQYQSVWDNTESLFETPLYFGSEVNSAFVPQDEKFEWLFNNFGVSLPTFDFVQGYDDIATSFTTNHTSHFVKNYSYLTNDEVMSSFTKNPSYLVNEKLEFVNYGAVNEFGATISSSYVGLYTVLNNLTLVAKYSTKETILDSVTLIARYQGLETIIKKSSALGRTERKENMFFTGVATETDTTGTRFLINLESTQVIEPEYFVDVFTPVQDIEPEYLIDLPAIQDIEPESLIDLPAIQVNESESLIDLPAIQVVEPEYFVDVFLPVQDQEPEYLIDLLPVQDQEPEYLIDLLPVQDQEPGYLVDLLPVRDIEPEYLIDLLPVRDIEPKTLIPFPAVLDADIMWTMDPFTNVGAYRTYIRLWANQGRGGDEGTALGTTIAAQSDHGNMIVYDKLYNYSYGGRLLTEGEAIIEKGKYYSAMTTNIATTDYWNYRILFNNRYFCVPRKGKLFPVSWYIRGG